MAVAAALERASNNSAARSGWPMFRYTDPSQLSIAYGGICGVELSRDTAISRYPSAASDPTRHPTQRSDHSQVRKSRVVDCLRRFDQFLCPSERLEVLDTEAEKADICRNGGG